MSQTNNSQLTTPHHLYSTIIKLAPLSQGRLPTTQGRLIHAAFLDLVRCVDPGLAEAIHIENQRRPFTLSPLYGLASSPGAGREGRAHNGHVAVRPGQELWLRFTLLHSDLFTTFTRYLLSPRERVGERVEGRGSPTLRLGEVTFAITEMLTTPGSHPWAGYTTLGDLCRKWQAAPAEPSITKIAVEFASGVVFSRSSDKNGLGRWMEFFPSPEMFFGSLAARWVELTGLPAPLENRALREYAKETVVVSAFELKTTLCHYWGNPQIGAVGRVTYELRDRDNLELNRFLNLLADFAFYSGVGAKTAMGMGQVRSLPDDKR